MKVLVVAPRICTPWTEGRKKFVRDLLAAAAGRWELCGLVTVDAGESTGLPAGFASHEARSPQDHLLLLARHLRRALAEHRPDLVLHFPFGAFTGLRGLANLWVIASIERRCRRAGVPCCTLMYSLTSEADSPLHRALLKNVYFNQYAGAGRKGIRFGVRLPPRGAARLDDPAAKTLLFMSGAAEPTPERLDYVLDTRGLRLLLQAGSALAGAGYRLIVAVPFLGEPAMRERLLRHPANTWPPGRIELRNEVRVPEVFAGVSAFVFPYGHEERQFVPTSLVEAMHFGVPTVLPRLHFLAQFHAPAPLGLVHEPGDVASLVEQVRRLDGDPAGVEALRQAALRFVETEYAIANTVADVEAIYAGLPAGRDGA